MPGLRLTARVVGLLNHNEIRVLVGPGVGLLDGGIHQTWPVDRVPEELRFPNAEFWVSLDDGAGEYRVERKET